MSAEGLLVIRTLLNVTLKRYALTRSAPTNATALWDMMETGRIVKVIL